VTANPNDDALSESARFFQKHVAAGLCTFQTMGLAHFVRRTNGVCRRTSKGALAPTTDWRQAKDARGHGALVSTTPSPQSRRSASSKCGRRVLLHLKMNKLGTLPTNRGPGRESALDLSTPRLLEEAASKETHGRQFSFAARNDSAKRRPNLCIWTIWGSVALSRLFVLRKGSGALLRRAFTMSASMGRMLGTIPSEAANHVTPAETRSGTPRTLTVGY